MEIYLDDTLQKITADKNTLLTLHYKSGEKTMNAAPRCLFPVTKPYSYIRFIDSEGQEIGIIRNLNNLNHQSYTSVSDMLSRYYFIPKIKIIQDISEEYGISHWTVVTDRGHREFDVLSRSTDIKTLKPRRVLIKDADNNRYEISDYNELSLKSRQLLEGEI